MAPQYGPPGPPPPYQPGPPYGPPQQPGKPFSKNVQYLLIGAGILIVVAIVAALAIATLAGDDEPAAVKPSTRAQAGPTYKVVSEKKRTIVVEVATTSQLRAVFDAVRAKGRPEGGYFVSINCSTGGTTKADNRLANGKFAVGQLGEAQTGLKAGKSELEINADRQCPAH